VEIVSADASQVKVLVVPTNEELVIAQETERVIGSARPA
jgi:acetate kinase